MYDLYGKDFLFLGSSVTEGSASHGWAIPEYFKVKYGCNVTKEAVCGTTLADIDNNSYVRRLCNNVSKVQHFDAVVCQLSTNDAAQELPLGRISEDDSQGEYDRKTILGAMEYIIDYTQKTWNCPVIFYTNSKYENERYHQMVDKLHELAQKWTIGVIDLWSDEDFNLISDSMREMYMRDEIHPTRAGYAQWWGPVIEEQIIKFMS